jgi:hypothetical protein
MNYDLANEYDKHQEREEKSAAPIPDYPAYHKAVVDACVELTAEKHRAFYNGMDYREEWGLGIPADETAEANVDATDWM